MLYGNSNKEIIQSDPKWPENFVYKYDQIIRKIILHQHIDTKKLIELKRGTKTNLVNIICKYFPHEDGHSFDRVYEALKPSKEERRTGAWLNFIRFVDLLHAR